MIYLLEQSDFYKIGFTDNIEKRIKQYTTHNCEFKLLYILDGDKNTEYMLHKKFKHLQNHSEWFNPCDEIYDYFKENGKYIGYDSKITDDDDTDHFKLYVSEFFDALEKINSLKELKVFILCLKLSVDRGEEGNIINISDVTFKSNIENNIKLNRQNINRALISLCGKGFLHKIDSHNYRINPQIAYCGSRHDRAKLLTKIICER